MKHTSANIKCYLREDKYNSQIIGVKIVDNFLVYGSLILCIISISYNREKQITKHIRMWLLVWLVLGLLMVHREKLFCGFLSNPPQELKC